MEKKQGWEYGKRALERSRSRINQMLNNWDIEKDGEITPRKISKKINMGIETVYRHLDGFKKRINDINNK
jgi:hypothetical protein